MLPHIILPNIYHYLFLVGLGVCFLFDQSMHASTRQKVGFGPGSFSDGRPILSVASVAFGVRGGSGSGIGRF